MTNACSQWWHISSGMWICDKMDTDKIELVTYMCMDSQVTKTSIYPLLCVMETQFRHPKWLPFISARFRIRYYIFSYQT